MAESFVTLHHPTFPDVDVQVPQAAVDQWVDNGWVLEDTPADYVDHAVVTAAQDAEGVWRFHATIGGTGQELAQLRGLAPDGTLPPEARAEVLNEVATATAKADAAIAKVRTDAADSSIDGATRRTLKDGTLLDTASSTAGWNGFILNGATIATGPDIDAEVGRYLRLTPGPTGNLNRITRTLTTPVDLSNGFLSVPIRVNGPGVTRIEVLLGTRVTDLNSTIQIGGSNITSAQLVPGRWNTLTFDPSGAFRYQAPVADDNNVRVLGFVWTTSDSTTTVDFGQVRQHSRANMSGRIIWQFDDGSIETYTNTYPILKAAGYVGSIPMEVDKVGAAGRMNLTQLQEVYDDGWEIVGHHGQQIPPMTDAEAHKQFQAMVQLAETNGWVRGRKFFVWPGGIWSEAKEAIAFQYFDYLRRVTSMFMTPTPWVTNKYAIPLSYVTDDNSVTAIKANMDKVAASGGVLLFVTHRIMDNPPVGQGDWSRAKFQEAVDYAKSLGLKSTTLTDLYVGSV